MSGHNYRILIRAFTCRRDVAHSLLLKSILEKMGSKVIVSSLRQFETAIKLWKPHAVIVNVQGVSVRVKELMKDTFVILVPGEGGEIGKNSIAQIWKTLPSEFLNTTDLAFFWNKMSMEECKKTFPHLKKNKLILSGNPKFDLIKFLPKKKKKKTNIIGFSTRFSHINQHEGINYTFVSLMPQRPSRTSNFTYADVLGFKNMMKVIDTILKKTDKTISIRPHPLEAIDNYYSLVVKEFEEKYRKRIIINSSLCIVEWLEDLDVLISPTSTAIYEAYLMKVPIISMDYISGTKKYYYNFNEISKIIYNSCHEPRSVSSLLNMIKKNEFKFKKNEELEQYLKNFHSYHFKQSSTLLIAEEVIKFLKKNKRHNHFFVPKNIVDIYDNYAFKREMKKNKLHWNCYYHESMYKKPLNIDSIIKNILGIK